MSWLGEFQSEEDLPEKFVYGLGISHIHESRAMEDRGHVEYQQDHSDGLQMMSLQTIWSNEIESEYIRRVLTNIDFSATSRLASPFLLNQISTGVGIFGFKGQSSVAKISTHTIGGLTSDIVFVYAPEGSRIQVIENNSVEGEDIHGRLIVLYAENDAEIAYAHVGGSGGGSILRRIVGVANIRSRITIDDVGWVHAMYAKSDTSVYLRGSDSTARLHRTASVLSGMTQDCFDEVRHEAHRTLADIEVAGVVAKNGKLIYRGLVDAQSGVIGMRGEQDGRFLALDRTSEIDSIPALDIVGKEVASVHKISIGFLSDTELFFPRSRGLSRADAGRLITEGVLAKPFEGLSDESVRALMMQFQSQYLSAMFAPDNSEVL